MNKKVATSLLVVLIIVMASPVLSSGVNAEPTTYSFSGQVLLLDGSPAPNVEAFLQDTSGGPAIICELHALDASGHFIINNVPAGTYTFYIESTDGDYNCLVSYSQTVTVPTVISVDPIYLNTISGSVTSGGLAITDATVYLSGDGPIDYNSFPGAPFVTATTDASGNYQFTGLPDGSYTLYVYAPSGAAVQTVTIHGNTNLGTTALTNSYTVSGAAHYSGVPPNVGVYLMDSDGRKITSTFSDSSGSFELNDIPAGTYTLNFYTISFGSGVPQAVFRHSQSITLTSSNLALADINLDLFVTPEYSIGALGALSVCFAAVISVAAFKHRQNKK